MSIGEIGGEDHAGPICPFAIESPVMQHRWERLSFLHWAFDPGDVGRLLPANFQVDPLEGRAWVGLVPFFMRVGAPGGQRVPWLSNFCETNVRTYVRDQEGRRGIWFFSLDAARLGAVVAARTTYRLPYFWSAMRLVETPGSVRYDCLRRWPGPHASSHVVVRIGQPYAAEELTPRDHFLTARWVLFSAAGRAGVRVRFARAHHQAWPLFRATAEVAADDLIVAAGLPRPEGKPLVHYSPGVDVRIGRPERYGAASLRSTGSCQA
ncbi:MAG: YqjF family protein [Actinomycetota bacterium]